MRRPHIRNGGPGRRQQTTRRSRPNKQQCNQIRVWSTASSFFISWFGSEPFFKLAYIVQVYNVIGIISVLDFFLLLFDIVFLSASAIKCVLCGLIYEIFKANRFKGIYVNLTSVLQENRRFLLKMSCNLFAQVLS